MEAKLEMLNINVFSSEDMKLCGNDVNIVRKIKIKDLLNCMEQDPKYQNSKILRAALANSATYN